MSTIMIVDDDRSTVSLLKMLLELDDFTVLVAGQGAEALQLAQATPPQVFMVDYHLADMDGVELIGQLRRSPTFAQTPIVMASGMDVADQALAAGATKFLTKPFDPSGLGLLFKQLMDQA